jgi:arylsulfatase A-like enzyme
VVYLQIYEPREQWGVPAAWRGIRTMRYTYARLRDKPWVLYDLAADPYQLANRVADSAYNELRSKLDLLLVEGMARNDDSWAVNLTEHMQFHRGPAVYRPRQTGRKGL